MKKYIGTKMIEAREMNRGDYNKYRGWTIPENENPADEGYLVKYADGYESWSPKKQFEEAYRDCMGMNFGIALELMKKGCKVAREGWNSKGMFLYHVPASSYAPCTEAGEGCAADNGKVPYGAYVAMKTEHGYVVPWQADQIDMLAEDWVIAE